MYSTCLFCGSTLGSNVSIERFPVGRRLAFDGERGRLWVICAACGRWNLSPLEERWEAIEECERAFRDTRLRTSTGQIGLARLDEGTELVRIGRPMRPEFAAWRYGGVMLGRMRRAWYTAGAVTTAALTAAGVAAAGPLVLLAGVPLAAAAVAGAARSPGRPSYRATRRAEATLRDDAGELLLRPRYELYRARLRQGRELPGGWALDATTGRWAEEGYKGRSPVETFGYVDVRQHRLTGPAAARAVGVLLARSNGHGGTATRVRDAVGLIERAGSPERYFARAESEARSRGWGYQDVWGMPSVVRLALEMASHEEAERRALEGELAGLEAAWRDAEEIAAISDALLVPPAVESRLEDLRRRRIEGLSRRGR